MIRIRYVGKPIKTFEGHRFVRRAGNYVCDIKLPNMAYLKILRSPYSRTIIRNTLTSSPAFRSLS